MMDRAGGAMSRCRRVTAGGSARALPRPRGRAPSGGYRMHITCTAESAPPVASSGLAQCHWTHSAVSSHLPVCSCEKG